MCNFNVLNKCRRLKLCIKTLKVQSHEIRKLFEDIQ